MKEFHSQLTTGAGPTTADSELALGSTITLPARNSGTWKIFGIFYCLVCATATAGQGTTGYVTMNASGTDVTPNPAPLKLPFAFPSFLGATESVNKMDTQFYNVNFEAVGKANLDFKVLVDQTQAVAPQVVAGVLYGEKEADFQNFTYVDRIQAEISSASDTTIGTITLSERAKKIVGFLAIATQAGVLTTAEELIGFVRLDSIDLDLKPMEIPLTSNYSAGLGATIGQGQTPNLRYIPCDLDVVKGGKIQAFLDLNTALTNACSVQVYVFYN